MIIEENRINDQLSTRNTNKSMIQILLTQQNQIYEKVINYSFSYILKHEN